MCEPTTLALGTLVVGTAATAASYKAQSQQARDAQNRANRTSQLITKSALDSYALETGGLIDRKAQEEFVIGQNLFDIQAQLESAKGQAVTGAAATGVGGNTFDKLMRSFAFIAGRQETDARLQLDWTKDQITRQQQGIWSQAESRIAGSEPAKVFGPSQAAMGLGLASNALSSATLYKQLSLMQPQNP